MSEPAPLSLTVTGTEEEIREYLDGPRRAAFIAESDAALRAKLKYGHDFKTADEALEWVRNEIFEWYWGSEK